MKSSRWIAALFAVTLACAAEVPGEEDQTDDLSDATYSMEMVRANPALLPGVTPPGGVRVNGHPRPSPAGGIGSVQFRGDESSWLYTANQLGQFLHLTEPVIFKGDTGTYSRQPGDLYGDDGKMSWDEIDQGGLGDCYFVASLSAVLYSDASRVVMVPRLQKGKVVSYYAIFYQASGRKVRVEVDPDLLRNTSGRPIYMTSSESKPGYEEWSPSLIEKAYALWHHSFDAIGNGGYAADALFAITGKKSKSIKATDPKVFAAIETAAANGKAQVACTYGDKSGVTYPLGIYSDHCYTVLGVRRAGSDVFVKVRNPWGPGSATDAEPTEPPSADGTPDGIFELAGADFAKLYTSVDILP